MTYNIIISILADLDVQRIRFYISEILKNPLGAEHVSKRIFNAIMSLSYFPNKYRIISKNIHILSINSYSIYYKVANDNVIILRVLSNKQQFNYYDVLN